jgi:hypothetical protein
MQPGKSEDLERKARLVVFLYPRSGYKNTARPCILGFFAVCRKKMRPNSERRKTARRTPAKARDFDQMSVSSGGVSGFLLFPRVIEKNP